jgi:hypothetical protein
MSPNSSGVFSSFGPCGLYCGACGATDCAGCHGPGAGDWVAKCRLRSCAQERGVEFCCSCSDYPCPKLRAFMEDEWPHHRSAKASLESVWALGKTGWLLAQKQKWSCPACGAEIHWYQRQCGCGQRLDAWTLPASGAPKT